MAIKEETYSRPCPVHGQLLTTKRTKTIRTKSGERYTKPFFYCSKCKAYYLIVDEFSSDFKQKSVADSGLPIFIVGKQRVFNETGETQIVKNKKFTVNSEILQAKIIPKGEKLPKQCPKCDKETHGFVFNALEKGKIQKVFQGKRCENCDVNYFPESLYLQHPEYFVIVEEKDSSHEVEKLLNCILTEGVTTKYKAAKQILTMYPEAINELKRIVDQLGLRNFTEMVIELSKELNLEWPSTNNGSTTLPESDNGETNALSTEEKVQQEKHSFSVDGRCKFKILHEGEKLPSKCLKCGLDTIIYKYETHSNGKEKKIPGRKCEQCNIAYFTSKTYKAHEKALAPFVLEETENNCQNTEQKIDSQIEESKNENLLEKISTADESDSGGNVSKNENKNISEAEKILDTTSYEEESVSSEMANEWETKKKKYEGAYNGPETYLEAFQVKKCIVCGSLLSGDTDIAWVQCNKCKAIYCEESFKHIFAEPVITIGKRK